MPEAGWFPQGWLMSRVVPVQVTCPVIIFPGRVSAGPLSKHRQRQFPSIPRDAAQLGFWKAAGLAFPWPAQITLSYVQSSELYPLALPFTLPVLLLYHWFLWFSFSYGYPAAPQSTSSPAQ